MAEAAVQTIRRAHAVQSEYSLWFKRPEAEVLRSSEPRQQDMGSSSSGANTLAFARFLEAAVIPRSGRGDEQELRSSFPEPRPELRDPKIVE
jgi:hypothetical protein